MSNELFSNNFRVLIAEEATSGVDQIDILLTTATRDVVYQDVRDLVLKPTRVSFKPTRRRAQNSGVKSKSFADLTAIDGEFPMTGREGAGAGEEAPFYAALFAMIGFKVAIVAATSATYTPATQAQPSCTIYKWERHQESTDWRLKRAVGARATATISLAVNEEAFITVTGMGLYVEATSAKAVFFAGGDGAIALRGDAVTAVTAPVGGSETQNTKTLLGCEQMTVTYDGVTMCIDTMEININRTVDVVRCVTGTPSVKKLLLGVADGAKIAGTFSLNDSDTGYDKVIAAWEADTELPFIAVLTDGVDTVTITMPKLQIVDISESANGNIRTWDVSWECNGDWSALGADNDISIAFT